MSTSVEKSPLAGLISALELAIRRTDPRAALQASLDCLAKAQTPEHGAIASLIAMSSHARLGRFEKANASLLNARCLYEAHLAREQQDTRLAEADDPRQVPDRDLPQNPWLHFIMGPGYEPPLYKIDAGDLHPASRKAALNTWADFVGSNREFMGTLAYLYFSNGQYTDAVQQFESIILMARRYEPVSPVRIELAWPLVLAGDCYRALQEPGQAAARWNRARSLELASNSTANDCDRFAGPWIEKAKSRLLEHGVRLPTRKASLKASDHLSWAIQHLLEAEQFETPGAALDELVDGVRHAGRRYLAAVDRAGVELEKMRRLDPFAWALCPVYGSSCWYRYECASGYQLQKMALLHLSKGKLAAAIAAYKQASDIWPALSSCAVMGGLQAACGLRAEAKATFEMCMKRAAVLGAVESPSDYEEILSGVRAALSELVS